MNFVGARLTISTRSSTSTPPKHPTNPHSIMSDEEGELMPAPPRPTPHTPPCSPPPAVRPAAPPLPWCKGRSFRAGKRIWACQSTIAVAVAQDPAQPAPPQRPPDPHTHTHTATPPARQPASPPASLSIPTYRHRPSTPFFPRHVISPGFSSLSFLTHLSPRPRPVCSRRPGCR